jgi:hypothetical protein
MIQGDFARVDMMMPNRRRMYYSLLDKVIELSEKRAFVGKSLIYIVSFAVASPAPEFFVTHQSFRVIRSYLKNNHYDDDGRFTGQSRIQNYQKKKQKRLRAMAKAQQSQQ